eukprot:GEMP01016903.1.p1 GENE.GEMP01016903.1~~GEMP01016903.1.p1  ORF type:complete len:295 (+),score=83.34 GEMP01016903.1:131-1015(+)
MKRVAQSLRVALIQLRVTAERDANVVRAVDAIQNAAKQGAELVVLPEVWNGPYDPPVFPKTKEKAPNVGDVTLTQRDHPSLFPVWEAAKACKVALIAGSIPEDAENNSIYNSSVVFSPSGEVIAKHRKAHLFDIDIPGKIRVMESETLSGGQGATVVDILGVRVGIAICYDVRFPELFQLMNQMGAQMFVVPGAFNTTTGPKHWELLMRARAVDQQAYVLACSPARNPDGYQAWGHSMVVNPWGEVVKELEETPETIVTDLDFSLVDDVRMFIPVSKQRRLDIYRLETAAKKDT